jgi:hypothetical protein
MIRFILAAGLLITGSVYTANAQLTIIPSFTTSDTTDFPGSQPIADDANASTIEATINQAIAQVTSLIANDFTFKIAFIDDPNAGLGESLGTNQIDLTYTQYRGYLEANSNKTPDDITALASLPTGTSTHVNNNATQVAMGGALLDAIGDTTDGNSLISQNNGLIGYIGLDMSVMNDSRTNYDTTKYDLVSTVTHEVDELLGIGGEGSTLGASATDVGPLDLFRYRAAGVRSYSTSQNVSSYFSINSGTTDLVHFNQASGGDYSDWGDGFVPADGSGNSPPQVQDAFGDTFAEPNMGPNEAIALDVEGWDMTAAGLALEEQVPEPSAWALVIGGGAVLLVARRRAGRRSGARCLPQG